jgi:Ca-activated chloride channel family protein
LLIEYFNHIRFAYPLVFLLFSLIPLMIFWYARAGRKSTGSLRMSTLTAPGLQNWKTTFVNLPFVLRLFSIACLIIALARPQTELRQEIAEGKGIDIILCIDVSGSMTAQDFTPNRLEAAKKVATDFVNRRLTDRIGVVIFSGESFTQCPLTTDHSVLVNAISNIRNGLLEDGTAIGSGLSTSVDRLRSANSPSKVVLLLTDGENNGGLIDPQTAKEIARTFSVRVYTIGVGSDGYAPKPIQTPLGVVMEREKVSIDEKLLTEIAAQTGGRYFRAKDNEGLAEIYSNIDMLEKTPVSLISSVRKQDKFFPFAAAALFLLFIEMLLRLTVFRKFP